MALPNSRTPIGNCHKKEENDCMCPCGHCGMDKVVDVLIGTKGGDDE